MHKIKYLLLATVLIGSCTTDAPEQKTTAQKAPKIKTIEKPEVKYTLLTNKDSIKKILNNYSPAQQVLLCAINRVDSAHLPLLDTMLLPDHLDGTKEQYLPFPGHIVSLEPIHKVIFFSYPAQIFAAYEEGNLVYTGQTNMGRKKDPTPTGLFFTNWKAEKTTSTFDDEWELKWNFNVENKEGVGFHEYTLPGYPASHSCMRLTDADAQDLYHWADQWVLKNDNEVEAKGTPVIVFGAYPFGSSKPWLQLANNSHALDMDEKMVQNIAAQYLQQIEEAQKQRAAITAKVK